MRLNISRQRLLTVIILLAAYPLYSQRLELLYQGKSISFRGLSAVNNQTVWVSGSKGTVGLSANGGSTWRFLVVSGYENSDFRDIEAFDGVTAVIMAAGTPAVILRTTNGGKTWKKVYANDTQGMFLDAMEFWNAESGIVVGDPVNAKFFIARTFDGGAHWQDISSAKLPVADSGEACFAASGTNVRALDRDEACFVSGGRRSRLFWKGAPVEVPLAQGRETQGANSVAVWHKGNRVHHVVVVGGDFAKDTVRRGNCAVSRDGGKTWIIPSNPPYGYRSCVEFVSASKVVSCGLTGVDISFDEGINWNNISSTGFNVCRKAKDGGDVFLAGEDGRIGKISF